MKTKTFLTIVALFIGAYITNAQTIIYGGPVEGIWSLDKSPYVIRGAIHLDEFSSLSIEPGVQVIFETTESFLISGNITAEGTIADTILFTTNNPERGWGGMRIHTVGAQRGISIFSFCKFEYAKAMGYHHNLSGGALGIMETHNLTIENCLFEHNSALRYNIENPWAGGSGGAIAIWSSSITMSKNVFRYNEAVNGGALFISDLSGFSVDNSLFYGNTAENDGGAIAVSIHSDPVFINCTFADNYANHKGGAVALAFDANAKFTNSILWGNSAMMDGDQIHVMDKSLFKLVFTNIEGGLKNISGYDLNDDAQVFFDVDPQFLTFGKLPYWFANNSPCVDMGTLHRDYLPSNFHQPESDLHGNSRITKLSVDLGYYECNVFAQAPKLDGNHSPDPIVRYSDWEVIEHTGSLKNLTNVHFADDQNGYIVAESGTVIFTHDRGLSWDERYFGPSVNLTEVYFVDAMTGFVAGTIDIGPETKGVCYKTTDGGLNWVTVYLSETSMMITSIAFADDQQGFITGHTLSSSQQNGIINNTTDGGKSWDALPQSPVSISFDNLTFSSDNTGWMTGRMDVGPYVVSAIYKSEDKGRNWEVVYFDYTETGMQSIDFFGREFGMATGSDGSVYITYNSGMTWEHETKGDYKFNDIQLGSNGLAYLVGDNGSILASANYGKNWETSVTMLNSDLNAIFRTPLGFHWVVGDNGTLYFQKPKSIDPNGNQEVDDLETKSTTLADKLESDEKSDLFVEHKSYPNPFTGQTTISFELDQAVYVQLRIYSVNGQLVETLLDQTVEAGMHNIKFVADGLPQGIYSYSLTASNSVEHGKMIITN